MIYTTNMLKIHSGRNCRCRRAVSGSPTPQAISWKNILQNGGTDLIGDVPPGHWLISDYYDPDPARPGKTYAKRGRISSRQ